MNLILLLLVKIKFYSQWIKTKKYQNTSSIGIWGNLSHLIKQFPVELLKPSEAESEASFKAMQPLMEEKLDFFFNHTIKDKLPMMSMFIGEKTVAQLKSVFLEELANIFPQIIGQFAQNATMNISTSFTTKLSDKLAPIVMKAIKPIQWAAFILGICWGGLMVFFLHSFWTNSFFNCIH